MLAIIRLGYALYLNNTKRIPFSWDTILPTDELKRQYTKINMNSYIAWNIILFSLNELILVLKFNNFPFSLFEYVVIFIHIILLIVIYVLKVIALNKLKNKV